MKPGDPLPDPKDPALRPLLGKKVLIYALLHETRDSPLTYVEMQERLPEYAGQSQFQRRVRELHKWFEIEEEKQGQESRHRLVAVRDSFGDTETITGRQRAKALEKGRCFRCGRTPEDDGIKLVVDHRIPRNWGGKTEDQNLQPLCVQCNHDKQDRLSEHESSRVRIAKAISYPEPQKRIGELLKAFDGEEVPSDLVQIVASAGRYRNDWERRFRDLRSLGWDVRVRKVYRDGKPVDTVYWVEEWQPWPEEGIAAALRRASDGKKSSGNG